MNLNDEEEEQRASDNSDEIEVVNSDVYDDNSIEIVDGLEPLSDKTHQSSEASGSAVAIHDDDIESSGDGSMPTDKAEDKSNYIAIPIDSDPKSSVSSHLQRLSQLIQSLSDSQHNKSQTYELGPNDLNTFLANHNIQTEYQQQLTNNEHKHVINTNGKIPDDHLSQILDLQHKLQAYDDYQAMGHLSPTPMPSITSTTKPPQHFGETNFPDPSRIYVKGSTGLKTVRRNDPGYSSSQIVVNRPEGSVLFSLPSPTPQVPAQQSQTEQPYISQETLKAVLELSKQMIASNQNNQHYNGNQNYNNNQNQNQNFNNQDYNNPNFNHNYLQPIFRPVYYNIPINELPIPIITRYEPDGFNKKEASHSSDESPHMEKISSVSGYVDTTAPASHNSAPEKTQGDEHSTIIHNHIPITIEGPSPSNQQVNRYNQPTARPLSVNPQTTAIETRYDSFGGKVVTNTYSDTQYVHPSGYQPYPPFTETREAPATTYGRQEVQVPSASGSPPFNNYQFNNYQQQSPDPSSYFPQQQPPYSTYNPYAQHPNPNLYTANPHLTDNNVNNFINVNTPAYPTLRPGAYATQRPYATVDPVSSYQNQIKSPATNGNRNEGISTSINTNQPLTNNKYVDQTEPLYDDEATSDDDSISYDTSGADDDSASDTTDLHNDESVISLLTNLKQQQRVQQTRLENKQLPERRHGDFLSSIINGEIVNDALNYGSSDSSPADDNTDDVEESTSPAHGTIVHYGDTYMTYDAYRESVAPLLQKGPKKVEMFTCVTGARQPSSSDCSKYFVCNAASGKVLTYICPAFTAFNQQTRFCDAKTYASCHSVPIKKQITIDGNKKLKEEAEKALSDAKRVRDEAIQAQHLTALIKQETQNILNSPPNYIRRPSAIAQPIHRLPVTTTTKRPRRKANKPRKRRIQCTEPTKVADKLSKYNYFTCFKGADGQLKAMKQTCPGGLVFCARMRVCTAKERCGR